ncbi:uncharacterized protein LOC135099407 [Scylla paramamosain]|uniref:uncharacterized protein LOC135099407 n=1 Tax=Scylla paramamosain TaxID=85552 RepID=UPI003082DADF
MAAAPKVCVRRIKLICLMENAGKDVLTFVLKRGALNAPATPPGQSFTDYLDNFPEDSTANYGRMNNKQKRSALNHTERRQAQRFPLWDKFDVTFLHKAIKLTCEHVAKDNDPEWRSQNTLEGLVTKIKDERNELFHEVKSFSEAEYQHKVNELEHLFIRVLAAAKTKYCIPDAEVTPVQDNARQVTDTFRKIGIEKEILKDYFSMMHQEFLRDSQTHLKTSYDRVQTFDPLSFLTNSPKHCHHIQDIFCKMSLVEGRGHLQQRRDIDTCDVLTVTRRAGQNPQPSTSSSATPPTHGAKPQLILIRGVAGSGKTTLLTFLVSEWLQDPGACTIKHLDEYDIVVRVLCRDDEGPSLQNFLKVILPNHFAVMDEHLIPLLQQCKVLFLIDGLDELSPGTPSHSLVKDILNISKYSPDFTLVCTSRPETVEDFLVKVPDGYEVWDMEMKGVSHEQRIHFVMKHYNSFPDKGDKDPERLEYLMKQIGWKDYLGLPLNLHFIAWLFYLNVDNIKVTTTQTSLYVTIRDCCIQKLQARLTEHSLDRQPREVHIYKVLEDIYDVSMQAILEDRLTLSKQEEQMLICSCHEKGLPSKEVIPAFLNLEDTSDRLGHHQKYAAPHKSLQEFYGASAIVHKLVEGSHSASIRRMLHDPPRQQLRNLRNLLQYVACLFCHPQTPCRVSDIRRMLHFPPPENLRNLRNLLLHVAGLLCHPNTPLCAAAIQEVVDLLAETGVKRCSDWLSMLEDTEVNRIALDCVVRHITSEEREWVTITDSTITSARALLPLIPSKVVRIELSRKESDVQGLIFEHHKYIVLNLHHQYRHPDQATLRDSLLRAMPRSRLEWFTGHLSGAGTQLLQEYRGLGWLRLAVCDQDAQEVLAAISAVHASMPQLGYLVLHVPVGAVRTQACTTRLPGCPRLNLVLSGVDERLLEEAVQIAQLLQPTQHPYYRIRFPGSSMKADVWRRCLLKLANAGIKVHVGDGFGGSGGILAPDTSPITKEEERELYTLARTMMLRAFARASEEDLWR